MRRVVRVISPAGVEVRYLWRAERAVLSFLMLWLSSWQDGPTGRLSVTATGLQMDDTVVLLHPIHFHCCCGCLCPLAVEQWQWASVCSVVRLPPSLSLTLALSLSSLFAHSVALVPVLPSFLFSYSIFFFQFSSPAFILTFLPFTVCCSIFSLIPLLLFRAWGQLLPSSSLTPLPLAALGKETGDGRYAHWSKERP